MSLNCLEGLGMSTLEAMASGCMVVGLKGIGGAEYATSRNGFWVDDNDCEACADALVRAMALWAEGRARVEPIATATRLTADQYSFDRFAKQLLGFWGAQVPSPDSAAQPATPLAARAVRIGKASGHTSAILRIQEWLGSPGDSACAPPPCPSFSSMRAPPWPSPILSRKRQ